MITPAEFWSMTKARPLNALCWMTAGMLIGYFGSSLVCYLMGW